MISECIQNVRIRRFLLQQQFLFKLDCSTCSYHNSTNTGLIDMFFTKKCNYFSQGRKWECLILSQIPLRGRYLTSKLKGEFLLPVLYSIITRIQSEIISIKLKNPPNIYLKVFDTIINFYTTVEYNECKFCIATLLLTESDTLCLLN